LPVGASSIRPISSTKKAGKQFVSIDHFDIQGLAMPLQSPIVQDGVLAGPAVAGELARAFR